MQINLIKKKFLIKLKMLYFLPFEICDFFLKKIFKSFFISDNASWATDNTTKFINKFFEAFKIKYKNSYIEPKNQFLFYTDQYSILKSNFQNKKIILQLIISME